ncbi:MAG: hypothetical protein C0624_13600 [Desulfuromonas sp.]|nr:MAG: hypothetical protein C0624_13600 [Desulfuromonas sp.]
MEKPIYMTSTSDKVAERGLFVSVYTWMGLGLALTAFTALLTLYTPALLELIVGNRAVFYGLVIGELLMVVALSAAIGRLSASTATLMFLAYSALNGLTLSIIFLMYTSTSIVSTFFITAGTFGAMSLYGMVTKRDLTSWGSFLFMGLIGLIIASVVNIFLQSAMVYWISSYIGVFIFIGLTAYDTQKIKRMGQAGFSDTASRRKLAIMGALTLYLDFINMFLFLLRIFGNRR